MGIRGCGQFNPCFLCQSFLLKGEDSSHSSLAQNGVPPAKDSPPSLSLSPSHGLQLCMNCSSLHCSQRTQSFRNRLLHHVSSTGSQDLSANLLLCEFLASWPQVLPGPCSYRVTTFFWASTCCSMGSSTGYRQIYAPLWISVGCRDTAVSPWFAPQAAGESLLQLLNQHLHLLLH